MTTKKRGGRVLLLGLAAALSPVAGGGGVLGAQEDATVPEDRDRGTVGVFLGSTSSLQLWTGSFASDRIQGFGLGVFVDVRTPVQFLSIRAEAGYAGRGGLVWDEVMDPEGAAEATLRGHYLSFPVHGKMAVGLGPISGYLFAGPTLDFLLDTGCSAEFCQAIREEKTTVFSVAGGVGLGVELGSRLRAGFELRLTEGISDAYLVNGDSARNRTTELLVRVGRPL